MGQKSRVPLIHETIGLRESKLACCCHKLNWYNKYTIFEQTLRNLWTNFLDGLYTSAAYTRVFTVITWKNYFGRINFNTYKINVHCISDLLSAKIILYLVLLIIIIAITIKYQCTDRFVPMNYMYDVKCKHDQAHASLKRCDDKKL